MNGEIPQRYPRKGMAITALRKVLKKVISSSPSTLGRDRSDDSVPTIFLPWNLTEPANCLEKIPSSLYAGGYVSPRFRMRPRLTTQAYVQRAYFFWLALDPLKV